MVLIFLQVVETKVTGPLWFNPAPWQVLQWLSCKDALSSLDILSSQGNRLMLVPVSSPALGMPSPRCDPV